VASILSAPINKVVAINTGIAVNGSSDDAGKKAVSAPTGGPSPLKTVEIQTQI
jgi:hypothetical protein